MSRQKESAATRDCRPWPLKTPPVHKELSTPKSVATSAAGRTLAPSRTTVVSDVVRPTTAFEHGSVAATMTASTAKTRAVASQKESRAAAPSPRPRWKPTRTAMTMVNMALTAPDHTTVAVLTAVVAATASVPNRDTNSVVLCDTTAEKTRVPTRGTACLRYSAVLAGVCSDARHPGQNAACSRRQTNMYSQYVSGCRHRLHDRLTAAPTKPSPRQFPKAAKWRNGPPKTKIQLSAALTKRNTTEFHIAGRGLPTDWK